MIALGSSIVIGLVIGAVIRDAYQPGLDPVAIAVYTLVGVAIGAGLSLLLKHPPIGGALVGGALGWVLGAWGAADLGDGSPATSILAAVVPAVLLGLRLGMTKNPDYRGRVAIDNHSRAVIFIGPALAFISVMLVIPALRTAYLSLLGRGLGRRSSASRTTSRCSTTRTASISTTGRTCSRASRSSSGSILLVVAVVAGVAMKKRTGRAVEIGNPTVAPLVVGLLFVCVRRLHRDARHAHQQPLVGRRRHLRVDGDGPGDRRARRSARR